LGREEEGGRLYCGVELKSGFKFGAVPGRHVSGGGGGHRSMLSGLGKKVDRGWQGGRGGGETGGEFQLPIRAQNNMRKKGEYRNAEPLLREQERREQSVSGKQNSGFKSRGMRGES